MITSSSGAGVSVGFGSQRRRFACRARAALQGGSGACIAAAVIENGTTVQADFCVHAKSERSLDERTAFEIGSITKTMTVALLAEITGLGEIAIEFDAALQPRRKVDGTYTFTWHAFGGRQQAERVGATVHVAVRPAPTEPQLKGYEGNYSYSRTLGLRVYASGPKLMVQGTGRAPLEAAPFNKDILV
jgi:hypothetical protein